MDPAGYFEQKQPTIFDRLSERAVDWKIYFSGIPQTVVFCNQRKVENMARYFYMQQFYEDARGDAEEFPEFSLIEPDFMGTEENDDHPPHDIMKAQKLIADVYNALRANEELWNSTLLVIYYDEHGGFYDHVTPPSTICPDGKVAPDFKFDRLGLRVPALLVSPWVAKGVLSTRFDHTSVLKYLIDKWGLGSLGRRAAEAISIGTAIQSEKRLGVIPHITLTPEQLNPPDADKEEQAEDYEFGHHKSLALIGSYIKLGAFADFHAMTGLARIWVSIKEWCERQLAKYAGQAQSGMRTTSLRPDRLSRDRGTLREDFANYFALRQKQAAVADIATTIRDPEKSPAVRGSCSSFPVSHLSGHKFHREENPTQKAHEWLKMRGVH